MHRRSAGRNQHKANDKISATGRTAADAAVPGVEHHPCPRCSTNGIVDFVDLTRGRAELHCPACPTGWAESTTATMDYLAS